MSTDSDSEICTSSLIKEWETARSVISGTDDNLHDLRKYGFTFLTALLAAESVILPVGLTQTGIGSVDILPDETKFAVLLVNLLLITALQFIDRNYQVIQGAASKRASVLEKELNFELTEVITQRFNGNKAQHFIALIYFAFIAGVWVLGSFALYPNYLFIVFLSIASVVAGFAANYMLKRSVKPRFPLGILDWTLSRLCCNMRSHIEITMTNLSNIDAEVLVFPKGTTMWQIRKEGDDKALKTEIAQKEIRLIARDSYTWVWKPKDDLDIGVNPLEEGIYRLYRVKLRPDLKPDLELKPLLRKIHVRKTAQNILYFE